jgi:hypothetical protein
MFHQSIELEESQIPQQIKSWFHICDLSKAIRTIDAIASAEIDLSEYELNTIAATFGTSEYFPDGKPVTRSIDLSNGVPDNNSFTPIDSQKLVLEQAVNWLSSDGCAFILKGMSSTGKKTLLQQIINIAKSKNKSLLLIAPNARLADKFTTPNSDEFKSIYQILYSNKSDGTVKKDNGIELAKHPIILENEEIRDKVIVIVEAHLISNSYYDMDNAIFGTGHMVNDLLSAFAEVPPKLLLVGDPYQLSRGALDQCLLSGQALKDKGLTIQKVFLERQIESEPKELHDFQFEIAQQMQLKQFNRLPVADNNVVTQIDNSPEIGKEITIGSYHAVYLAALNDVAHKINIAVKGKVLSQANPYMLNVGDLVDFHTSTPITPEQQSGNETVSNPDWIHSGEIVRVTAVIDRIEIIETLLKGRDVPTSVCIGYFKCSMPSHGSVCVSYIMDYLHAEKPELTQDQMLVLSIKAREQAINEYKSIKEDIDQINDKKSEEYLSEKKKYDELIKKYIAHSPLLNAARIRYAYAMTVHRAQGRLWNSVYLDASRSSSGASITNDGFFRFLYTASMCAAVNLRLLKYPKLTPLYQAQFVPNNNCKIGYFNISKGFNYQMPDKEKLNNFDYPDGFNSEVDELKALCFCVKKKLADSDWRINNVKQHSYQELYIFEHSSGKKIRVRFSYDKNIMVNSVAYLDENDEQELINKLKTLLDGSLSLDIARLNNALEAIVNFLDKSDYEVIKVKSRSEWEMLVGITNKVESIEVKVYVGKDGLISKLMPEKASSEKVIDFFREMINE